MRCIYLKFYGFECKEHDSHDMEWIIEFLTNIWQKKFHRDKLTQKVLPITCGDKCLKTEELHTWGGRHTINVTCQKCQHLRCINNNYRFGGHRYIRRTQMCLYYVCLFKTLYMPLYFWNEELKTRGDILISRM